MEDLGLDSYNSAKLWKRSHARTCTGAHAHRQTHTHACIHDVHARVHAQTRPHTQTQTCTQTQTRSHTHTHIARHTHSHAHTLTHNQTHTHTHTHFSRHTGSETSAYIAGVFVERAQRRSAQSRGISREGVRSHRTRDNVQRSGGRDVAVHGPADGNRR